MSESVIVDWKYLEKQFRDLPDEFQLARLDILSDAEGEHYDVEGEFDPHMLSRFLMLVEAAGELLRSEAPLGIPEVDKKEDPRLRWYCALRHLSESLQDLDQRQPITTAHIDRIAEASAVLCLRRMASAGTAVSGPPRPADSFRRLVWEKTGWWGLSVLASLTIVFSVWWNWDKVQNAPGIAPLMSKIFREDLVQVDEHGFYVAVVRLEHDKEREHERLLTEALKDISGVSGVISLDRRISSEGANSTEATEMGHELARELLRETRADLLFWGSVLKLSSSKQNQSQLKLYWTSLRRVALSKRVSAEVLFDPAVFWSNLEGVANLVRQWPPAEIERSTDETHIKRYLTGATPVRGISGADIDVPSLVIGSWNLEHFRSGAKRGFPENLVGGPTYQSFDRNLSDMATIIADRLDAAVMALSEVNGVTGSSPPRSEEMELLIAELGRNWEYVLSSDGKSLRVALLYDTSKVKRGACEELTNSSGPRDHLGCFFTFLDSDGSLMNDLVVIGVHLKSGMRNNDIHNAEIADLVRALENAFHKDVFPTSERDLVIAGDFNANLYDARKENFWSSLGDGHIPRMAVFAPENGPAYPPTSLRGVPLFPSLQIDYIMGTTGPGGVSDDLIEPIARVHHELLFSPFENFRRVLSDHIPITIRVALLEDDD